jgi:hypothetical protein
MTGATGKNWSGVLRRQSGWAALLNDPVTTERLEKLVKDLEEQLREPE